MRRSWIPPAESWPLRIKLAGEDRWVVGRLRLSETGAEVWSTRPFRRLQPEDVQAVTSSSFVARLILFRHGWPVEEEV
jgi:hypothetical protein